MCVLDEHQVRGPAKVILVVDDDRTARELMVAALEPLGRRVVTCGSAADALHEIAADPPGLVLTDRRLRATDGLDLVRAIKGDPSTRRIFPSAFSRVLVRAQSEERRLAQLPVGGPLRVGNLRDEPRPYPARITQAGRGIERCGLGLEPHEPRAEGPERLLRESGADLAGEAQALAVEEADEQRAEIAARPYRRRPAADHELRLMADLHLEPV